MTGPVLEHVTITASDFAGELALLDVALAALGLVRVGELVDEEEDDAALEAVGWGRPDQPAVVWLVHGPVPTTGLHLRLRAEDRVQVETFYRAAVAAGGHGQAAPRRWPIYRRGEFAATVRDPQGNLIEAVSGE